MAQVSESDVAGKLLASNFQRSHPPVSSVSDPIADTPMLVTLDQLRTYEHNPRIARNSRYDELRASILARGLDHPPPITRRPGESCYIVRTGGNTRLAILRELWTETRDERFFRIRCLFRPWSARGELVALTGHLCENELRGELSFIERAVAVERARKLYESENGQRELTQAELSQRLSADGYPITQPHISRMQETVKQLLPAIPTVLYAGLGKPQIERLLATRRETCRIYERHAQTRNDAPAFSDVFREVLAQFDDTASPFDVHAVQAQLLTQFAGILGLDADDLALEVVNKPSRATVFHVKRDAMPAEAAPDALTSTVRAIPVQVAGLHPIVDIWHIDATLDAPDRLRVHIGQLATEIAHEYRASQSIQAEDDGIGFSCAGSVTQPLRPALALLQSLSARAIKRLGQPGIGETDAGSYLATLLQGSAAATDANERRLSDAAVVKLFRLIRLARRLTDHDTKSLLPVPASDSEDRAVQYVY